MDAIKLRAWWAHRQGLDGTLRGAAPAGTLARTGWARSVGGVNPYLQLHARSGTSREDVDRAVAGLAIHELPSARGCAYVLPAADYALGLKAGEDAPLGEVAVVGKLGVPRAEIDALGRAVLTALDEADGPLAPKALREVLGDTVRNLGDAGRKKGVSTTLPVALGLLQATGRIRRVPLDGRLDNQRYAYTPWSLDIPYSEDEARTELARRYWSWTGGATLAQFRWFSRLGVRDAKAAVEPLGLVPLEGDVLATEDDAAEYARYVPPSEPEYALVGWIDGIFLLRRDLASMIDPADAARDLPPLLGRGTLGGLSDMPAQGIVDRGRLVGLWDFDADAGEIVWASFVPPDDALREAVARTEAFVRDELGDARGSSLDNPAKRRPRLEAIAALGRGPAR
ncbi:DNA glycosylase AlkZ-like family protein [Actinomadura rupiterrae]|uniref:DNA glycosylase AlkZ-like family protein n=1 Tax=Actinomadura rupiterrae TaxID=559627 RepID=UPI0020A43388|nr:crosslink repair DNA glycosylase YcaQ family protein [Actinomadura rupiterrae]MCP2335489.1 hypothetical protein [Actinomadura rupiterrae]